MNDFLDLENENYKESYNKNYIDISEFFNNDYVNFAKYDNLRKIANVVDGLKLSSRKVLHTFIEKNIVKDVKVSRVMSTVSEFTEYIHGEKSLYGVIVNLAQNFVGTNNINLLSPEGNFGERFKPAPAAERYIYTYKEKITDYIFRKEYSDVLIKQMFEGNEIEPVHFVPVIPMLLVNGSEGISSGFAQKILPRNPLEIINILEQKLKNNKIDYNILPYYKGFKGEIKQIEENKFEIRGIFERIGKTKLKITELPIGYTLSSYEKVLDTLEDKKIIKSYRNLSEDDNFIFELNVSLDFMKKDDEKILEILKLNKKITENYTSIKNYKIEEYKSIEDLINVFYEVKLEFTKKMKEKELQKIKNEIEKHQRISKFIKAFVENKIDLKKSEDIIIKDFEKLNFDKVDDSYEYLFKIPIRKLNENERIKLENKINELEKMYNELNQKTENEIWLNELETLKNELKDNND